MNITSFNNYTEEEIYSMIINVRNNDEKSFKLLIKIFHNKLILNNRDNAYEEMLSFFSELLLKIPLEQTLKNHKLINYILSSLKKKKYNILNNLAKEINFPINDNLENTRIIDKSFDLILCKDILSSLSEENKTLILLYYKYGYKDVEIGRMFGVSKQAIYKRKKKILNKIQCSFK